MAAQDARNDGLGQQDDPDGARLTLALGLLDLLGRCIEEIDRLTTADLSTGS